MKLGKLFCISDCGLAIVEAFEGTHQRLNFLQAVYDAEVITNGFISFKLEPNTETRYVSQFPYFFVRAENLSLTKLTELKRLDDLKRTTTNKLYAMIDALPSLKDHIKHATNVEQL